MASGVLSEAGQEATFSPASESRFQEGVKQAGSGEAPVLTMEDVRRRLKIVSSAVVGVDASIDEAMQSALAYAAGWEKALADRGSPPSSDQYDRMLKTSFGLNLARKEFSRKKAGDGGHRGLFAGRTAADTPEAVVIDGKGNSVTTKPRQRWEFTKELIHDAFDPEIPDEKLRTFTYGGKNSTRGGQGFVIEYPGRNLIGKYYDPHSGKDETNRTRFDRESITMKHLDSAAPGASPAPLGKGNEGGREIIFMEKAPGRTLDSMIDEIAKLPDAKKYEIAAKLVLLVSSSLDAGVVHRDIKGDNIMYDGNSGICTLLDLGLARFRHNDGTSNLPYNPTLTKMGDVVGTVQYIAPMQAQDSSKADPRNDLHALGLLVYEILTGMKGRIPPKNKEGKLDYAQLFAEVRTPGFKEKLPLLYGSQHDEKGEIVPQLPAEGARAIEILIRQYKVDIPSDAAKNGAAGGKEDVRAVAGASKPTTIAIDGRRNGDAATALVNACEAAQTVNAVAARNTAGTVEFKAQDANDPGKQTIDFDSAVNKKLETTEERAAWIEAKEMVKAALTLLEDMAHGKGNAVVFRYRRKFNLLFGNAVAIAAKPLAVIAEVLAAIMAITGVVYYIASRDPSAEIVMEAEEPDPDYFNISSVVYADGSEDLVMQMPTSTGIPPERLKTGMHYWQKQPDGSKAWIGGATAIPIASIPKYFGSETAKLVSEANRMYHIKINNSRFMWTVGAKCFRPAGKKTRTEYGKAQPKFPKSPIPQNFPFVQKSQQSYEWPDVYNDPEFQEFLLPIDVNGIEIGANINPQPFEAADADVYTKENFLNVFTGNIKNFQSTIKELRALKLKEAENGKKVSTLFPNHLRHQFADRMKSVSADRRHISAVQARQYGERMDGA